MLVCKGQRGFDAFLVYFHAEDAQVGIDASEAGGAFEGGARVEAVAEVNEAGSREQAIGPREKRGFVEQEEVVDAAQSIGGGLAAGGLSQGLWFLGACWLHDIKGDSVSIRSPWMVTV